MSIQIVFLDSEGRIGEIKENSFLQHPISALTRREFEVAGWVCQGKSTHEIAAALHVEYETVRSHKKRLMRKLGVHTTPQLFKFLRETGFFPEK